MVKQDAQRVPLTWTSTPEEALCNQHRPPTALTTVVGLARAEFIHPLRCYRTRATADPDTRTGDGYRAGTVSAFKRRFDAEVVSGPPG
jgi:hypothetical protein